MFYLGQSILHRSKASDPPKAAILTGFTSYDNPLITTLTSEGELKKHETSFAVDIFPVRKKNPKSPTGYSIYTGKLAKIGFAASNVKLRLPDDNVLLAELKATQKIINSNT